MTTDLSLPFISEVSLRQVAGVKEMTVINDDGNLELIKIHHQFSLDGYFELTKELKEYLGLDDKWLGIAFEAQGEFWHADPSQQDADRRKKLILKEKNVIILEIWERWNQDEYLQKIIEQVEDQTGKKIPHSKLNQLKNYLGNRS